ncbi:hypothetical protein H072_5640 [Dactylellina haptotyla CBS 200.50]|uniref:Uncharacterized protein n=1 Tax=Dactylellina haptotyla (strain CBS 200.50) TaxID=1284197 RepID=S8ABY2_DACHA|nr:hypothetical protein H072_5640 [Dactylellina haptotyla CBS 200.50]
MLTGAVVAGICFAAVASGAAYIAPRAGCNADLCLRALRATQIAGRLEQASSDCGSFWVTTVTPPEVTITNTATYSTTYVYEAQATETKTFDQTDTVTVFEVETAWGAPTSTKTIFSPSAIAIKKKRAASVSYISGIPAYASACSGAARFTSACSCVGVTTARTVTAATPTKNVIITQTASFTITTTSVETDSLTLTATQTETAITSTLTLGTVATTTATKFKLQVLWTQTGMLRWVQMINSNGNNFLAPVDNFASAAVFSLDPSGTLYSMDNGFQLAYAPTPSSGSIGISLRAGSSVPSGFSALVCSINQNNNAVTCGIGAADTFTFWSANSSNLSLYRSGPTYNSVTAVSV